MQKPPPHAPVLMQAPVRALDPDGAVIITIGTAAFAVGGIFAWLELEALVRAGQAWWLGVCAVGFVIGIIGSAVSWTFHRRRKARRAAETVEDTPDPKDLEPPSAS